MIKSTCRFCDAGLKHTFADLGVSPLANSYVRENQLQEMEPFFPLHAYTCDECLLVQLQEYQSPQNIFGDYAYFSSYSESWLQHAKTYTVSMIDRFGFNEKSHVVEIASNDGYLLQYFKEKGIPVLGIEPAENVAVAAVEKGIPTIVKFFGVQTAQELVAKGTQADLLIGNNVLAHVPDLNDFVEGMKIFLSENGLITMEFPHLMRLFEENQFDTIYHEHFSYFSFMTVRNVFASHGLNIFDVEELPTHGGSLRIYACHADNKRRADEPAVKTLIDKETAAGYGNLDLYLSFDEKVKKTKQDILQFMIDAKREGRTIAGYGAPAKGNTLLNYCGIRTDFIDYTVDRSPHKQNHYLPGTRIPIFHPDKISETKPDYLVILPWNLKDEIMAQMAHIRSWGGKFVVFIPKVEIYS